jgi:hypothetical protein
MGFWGFGKLYDFVILGNWIQNAFLAALLTRYEEKELFN